MEQLQEGRRLPDWRAVPREQEGQAFVAPVADVVDVELTDEDRMNTTWTNLSFSQVSEAVKGELAALEEGKRGVNHVDNVLDASSEQWDSFYRRNATSFFKDRHYLQRDYPTLFARLPSSTRFLECGCGAGNTIWPLLQAHAEWTAHAFDCSETAVRLVREKQEADPGLRGRVDAFVWDPCAEMARGGPLPHPAGVFGMNLVVMMFFLSALPSEEGARHMFRVAWDSLAPGGFLLVRDYGVYDMTQLRFARKGGRKLSNNVYCRADGTLSRFFDSETLDAWATQCGFAVETSGYECRELRNRKRMIKMYRVWVSCLYHKPNVK